MRREWIWFGFIPLGYWGDRARGTEGVVGVPNSFLSLYLLIPSIE